MSVHDLRDSGETSIRSGCCGMIHKVAQFMCGLC